MGKGFCVAAVTSAAFACRVEDQPPSQARLSVEPTSQGSVRECRLEVNNS